MVNKIARSGPGFTPSLSAADPLTKSRRNCPTGVGQPRMLKRSLKRAARQLVIDVRRDSRRAFLLLSLEFKRVMPGDFPALVHRPIFDELVALDLNLHAVHMRLITRFQISRIDVIEVN